MEEGENHPTPAKWAKTMPAATVSTPLEAGEEEYQTTFPAPVPSFSSNAAKPSMKLKGNLV